MPFIGRTRPGRRGSPTARHARRRLYPTALPLVLCLLLLVLQLSALAVPSPVQAQSPSPSQTQDPVRDHEPSPDQDLPRLQDQVPFPGSGQSREDGQPPAPSPAPEQPEPHSQPQDQSSSLQLAQAQAQAQAAAGLPLNVYRVYHYDQMAADIEALAAAYPEAIQQVDIIGYSVYGRPIWAVQVGRGEANVLLNGSHHGREWISTSVLMRMMEAYAHAYENHQTYHGYQVRDLLDQVSLWFIPMVNPDGVELQQRGLDSFPASAHESLIRMNGGSRDFRRWKANGRGVDPNRQYPARWETLTSGPAYPSHANYRGTAPLTEPENQAMVNFTREVLPWMSASYHSSGRVIFFPSNSPHQDVARGLSNLTGYRLMPLARPAGGYTDWFVDTLGRPAYTPELSYSVGPTNPPLSVFPEEWQRNRRAGLYLAQRSLALYGARAGADREAWEDAPAWAPGFADYVLRQDKLYVPLGPWPVAQQANLVWHPHRETLTVSLGGQTTEINQPPGFLRTDRTEPVAVDPARLSGTVLLPADTLRALMAEPKPEIEPQPQAPDDPTPPDGDVDVDDPDDPAAPDDEPREPGDPGPDDPSAPQPPLPDGDIWAGAQRIELTVDSRTVHVDGLPVAMDAAPFIDQGRTYVPVRLVAEAFESQADWEPRDATVEKVILERPDLRIVLGIGDQYLLVTRDGQEEERQEFDGAARIDNGRTYLPFRALADAFGEEVEYSTNDSGRVHSVWFTRAPEPAA